MVASEWFLDRPHVGEVCLLSLHSCAFFSGFCPCLCLSLLAWVIWAIVHAAGDVGSFPDLAIAPIDRRQPDLNFLQHSSVLHSDDSAVHVSHSSHDTNSNTNRHWLVGSVTSLHF